MSVSSLSPTPLTNEQHSDAYYFSYASKAAGVLVNVPIQKGRALPLFDYSESSKHPFVIAARKAQLLSSEREGSIRDVLTHFYSLVRPKNPNEVLGLFSKKTELEVFPNWSVVMPWDFETPAEWKQIVEQGVKSENLRHDCDFDIDFGWAWTGPTSHQKCNIETKRLLSVLNSIELQGYIRSSLPDGDIAVNILAKSSDEWVWQSVEAQHRAAVLAALGYREIPVRVRNIIRRDDVFSWPNVARGIYSEEEALAIFDNIYYANYSHVSSAWDAYASPAVRVGDGSR